MIETDLKWLTQEEFDLEVSDCLQAEISSYVTYDNLSLDASVCGFAVSCSRSDLDRWDLRALCDVDLIFMRLETADGESFRYAEVPRDYRGPLEPFVAALWGEVHPGFFDDQFRDLYEEEYPREFEDENKEHRLALSQLI